MPRPPEESRATTVGKWLLAIVVPASALALGSLPLEALMVMSALSALSCGLLSIDSLVRPSRASRGLLVALVLLLGMTVLQALPLPAGLIRAISPSSAEIWERALSPLREAGPAWHPLSIAPLATRGEVLRGFFYGCTLVAALRVATLERGGRFLVRVIIFSTSLMAISALGHTAVSAEKVFGIYSPHELYAYAPGRRAPLLNTNHLAAYLGMGACVSLEAFISGRAMPRALSASTTLVLAAMSVAQGSRGAVGALLFGMALTLALTLYSKRPFDGARAGRVILGASAVAAAIVVTLSLVDARAHLLSRDLSKVDVARRSLGLVATSPWFGFGRGGFESVFSSVRESTQYLTWTNPENIVVQWLVDWGVPVTLGAFAILGWALRPQVVLRAVRPAFGAWVAILAALVHELADYHFEVPGIVALAVLCGAVAVSGRPPATRAPERAPRPSGSTRVLAFALVGGTVMAIVAAWPGRGHTLAEERRSLSAEAVDKTVTAEEFRGHARDALLRYPAEPFLPLMGAVRAQFMSEGSVVAWTARALERNPRFGRAHFVLARELGHTRHAAQARLEYRLAYQNDESLRSAVAREALPLVDDATSALELVPEGAAGSEMLDAMVEALSPHLPSTAVLLDGELLRRSPTATAPLRRRAEAAASDAINGAPWCDGDRARGCLAEALAAAEEMVVREPDKCKPHVLVARVLIKSGEVTKGLDGLEHAAETVADRAVCQREVITISLEAGQARRSDAALDHMVRGGCGATSECLDLYMWAAGMEAQRGHYVRAVRLYRRVADLSPDSDGVLEQIGALSAQDGVLPDGIYAYETLATRHPSDPRWPARLAELRARGRPSPRPPMPPL